jgi:hypothetical protein
MKREYAQALFLHRPIRAIERHLGFYADWFNRERPHEGLGLRTPDEVHAAKKRPPLKDADSGRLAMSFIGDDRRLPVFRLRRAT